MTKALSEIFGFGQPATPMTPAEKAAERERKKKEREAKKEQQAATREKRKEELDKKRAAEKKAKEERHDARIEKRGNRQVELARQNASGAKIRARAASKRQLVTGKGTTTSSTKLNRARVELATAKNVSSYKKAATSAKFHAMRKKINLQKSMMNQSTEYDMSTVEIISESCMVGLNEDMYFKVKIEGLPTMYVNSANREELRKDLVGLLRNPSKAVGDIKRVTPAEVKKRLRLRSQGKEEEEMNESESDGYYMMTQAKKSAASAGEDYNDRSVADRHTAKVAKKMGYTHKDYTSGTYYKSRMPGSRRIESVEMNEAQIDKMKVVSKGFNDRRGATLHNDQLVGSGKASHKSYVHKHKDNKFYVVDIKESSVTRSRISGEMDKASGRTQIDRKNDLAKAAKARQDSEKDLATFRKKNAKVLQSSIDEVTAGDVTAAYQRAMMHPQGSPERKEAMNYYHSVKNRHKHNPIDVGEATADVINKLKEYYTNESSAYYAGLSKSTADDRKAHFKKHGKKADDDNSAYKPAPGDATAKTKPSIHTKKAAAMGMGPKNEAGLWANIHAKRKRGEKMRKKGAKGAPTPEAIRSAQKESYNINENKKGLENKAEKSGMPLGVLKQVYNRGMAAWKTGHRPGTTPEQWGMARVNSFITKSSGTWGKADKDLAAKVKK